MDPASAVLQGSVGGISIATLLGIALTIYKCVNHKRCRSKCCGVSLGETSLDIGTTPRAAVEAAAVAVALAEVASEPSPQRPIRTSDHHAVPFTQATASGSLHPIGH